MKNFLFLFFLANFAAAHEGHDHDAPTLIQAPKGGVIKALDESRVEVVARGKEVKIYFYDQAMKPLAPAKFKVVAKAELPRSKKMENIELQTKENFFAASFDAKGLHRYTLRLTVTDLKLGHADELNFTIEPRK